MIVVLGKLSLVRVTVWLPAYCPTLSFELTDLVKASVISCQVVPSQMLAGLVVLASSMTCPIANGQKFLNLLH